MRLPHADRVLVDLRKVRAYLLARDHPVGRFKAQFFFRLGFSASDWRELQQRLREIAAQGEAEVGDETPYGQKYVVRGTLKGPTGHAAQVRTVWIVLVEEQIPRLVTVYPETR